MQWVAKLLETMNFLFSSLIDFFLINFLVLGFIDIFYIIRIKNKFRKQNYFFLKIRCFMIKMKPSRYLVIPPFAFWWSSGFGWDSLIRELINYHLMVITSFAITHILKEQHYRPHNPLHKAIWMGLLSRRMHFCRPKPAMLMW